MLFNINAEESERQVADSIGQDSEIERMTTGEFTRRHKASTAKMLGQDKQRIALFD